MASNRANVGAFSFTGKSNSKVVSAANVPRSTKQAQAEGTTTSAPSRRPLSDISNNTHREKPEPRKLSIDLCPLLEGRSTSTKRKSTPISSCVPPLKKNTSSVVAAKVPPASSKKPVATGLAKCNAKPVATTVEEFQSRSPRLGVISERRRLLRDEPVITPEQRPESAMPPSKLSSLRKKILEKVAGKSIAKQPKTPTRMRSTPREEDLRRLSMVLRSEKELLEKNKANEERMQRLQEQCYHKENEIESVRNVGKMLGKLCVSQAEELKAIKGAFPSTLREAAQLRQVCQNQEKELRDARTMVPSLQEQVKLLTAQLETLACDIEKVKSDRIARRGLNSGFPSFSSDQRPQPAGIAIETSSKGTLQTETNANLEAIMHNLTEDRELSTLEQTCTRAFRDLGF